MKHDDEVFSERWFHRQECVAVSPQKGCAGDFGVGQEEGIPPKYADTQSRRHFDP